MTAKHPPKTPLLVILPARIVLNTTFRIIYPFLPGIARGLDISLAAAGRLVTLRMVGLMAAPILGPLADRYGRRRTMTVALLILALGSLLLSGAGTLVAAALAFVFYGVAKALYDPAVYAYVGDTVPYHERGRTIGLLELSWSGAWLLGVPTSGFLIERFGWRAPWAILGILGLCAAWLARTYLPLARRPAKRERGVLSFAAAASDWRKLLRRRPVVVLLLVSLFLTLANEIPFIVYGAWIETRFNLSLSALGVASIVVGLAETTAELGASALTDRLGKRRSILVGLTGLAVSSIVWPWLSGLGLVAALGGVALMLLTFEFALVSLLPLATELAPDMRASFLALIVTAFSISRILGTVAGGWLWRWENIALHAAVGATCALVAAWGMAFLPAEAVSS
ncbi:MAG: MFS transporter [Chloroflexota bacterium]|nr:MFS transporter [Chloroflexota bacterium]